MALNIEEQRNLQKLLKRPAEFPKRNHGNRHLTAAYSFSPGP